MGFSDSVNKNIKKILEEVDDRCLKITYRLFNEVIQTTPSPAHPGKYSKGLLANQWYPLIGKSYSTAISSATNPMGADSVNRVSTLLLGSKAFLGKDNTITMTNNVSYAYRAEVLGWKDLGGRTGPYRMVFTALQKISAENK